MPRRTDWAALRAAFEGGAGVDALCERFALTRTTIMRRAKHEHWQSTAARADHPAISTNHPKPQRKSRDRKKAMAARLYAALEKTMSDLEERLANPAAATAIERERDAKLLGSMAALYEKLKGMQSDEHPRAGTASDAASHDAESLRNELAARLDGLRRSCSS
jgi:hypothetical protein